MYRGPVNLEDLCGLLLRFRIYKVALTADIEKAFLQVGLQPAAEMSLGSCGLKIPLSHCPRTICKFIAVRGPIWSYLKSFLLGATILHHLKQVGTPTAEKIMKHMYVDHLLTQVNSSKEAREFYSESKEVFQESSVNLREWGSNSKEFLKSNPQQDREKETITKVLGILWNLTIKDHRILKSSKPTKCSSKREVLKSIATVFDPLGFFTPATLLGKLFLQELRASKKEWVEKLDEEMLHEWMKLQKEIECISMVTIPRFIGNSNCHLLCFCDASTKAYVSVIYLSSDVGVNLLFSKVRVAPIKEIRNT